MSKLATVIGCTGMDGSTVADQMVEKGIRVIGVSRRSSTDNKCRIRHLLNNPLFEYRECDVTDPVSVNNIIKEKPDYVFHLAAQSHVGTSFSESSASFSINTIGTINVLESIKLLSLNSRLYFAGSSEQFGSSIDEDGFQRETTPFQPQSPYAISKVASYHLVRLYRETYGLHASCGILFNHEGPRRGSLFLTKKISEYCADLYVNGYSKPLLLGNLSASRDWGYAPEYCNAMWLMLQQDKPDDYVIATSETHSVEQFCQEAFSVINKDYRDYVEVDQKFIRPAEVNYLKGCADKAKRVLGWEPKVKFKELVKIMVESDVVQQLKNRINHDYSSKNC